MEAFLAERGLRLSAEKTVVRHVDAGFDFLGMSVRKYQGRLLIRPRKKGVLAFLDRAREVIKAHPTATTAALIGMLNPMIRGWANYNRHVVSSAIFSYVDHEIWKTLWRWAIRRHPNKGRRWVKAKYFVPHGGRQWVFTGENKGADGVKRVVRLFAATSVHITRHILIRGNANPFHPGWRDYFTQRRARRSFRRTSQVANPANRPHPQTA